MVAAQHRTQAHQHQACFNPCKGFGVVAAALLQRSSERFRGFNPCKGFGVVAAPGVPAVNPAPVVSIPVRVLGWLQPQ